MKRGLPSLLEGMAAIATLCILLSLFAPGHWLLALLEHPRPQYCFALVPVLFWGVLTQRWRRLAWSLPLVLNLWLIGPAYWPPFVSASSVNDVPSLTMIHLNLDKDNLQPERAIAFLQNTPTDLIWLQEVTPAWLERLQTDLPDYEVIRAKARKDSQGVALLRSPTAQSSSLDTEILHLPDDSPRPMIAAQLQWQGQTLTILSLHATRPRNAETTAFQTVEFEAVASWLQEQENAIALGDLNSTPWSHTFRQFLRQSGLVDSLPGWGWQTTWHTLFPPPLRIPIDHCLHSPSIQVLSRSLGPAIGSDHFPLLVTVALPSSER